MKSSDLYFHNIQKMAEIKTTNISQKELMVYYKYGEDSLIHLRAAIKEMLSWGKDCEIAPSIPPRDKLPDMYMRFGYWDDSIRVLNECYKSGALSEEDLAKEIHWINLCKKTTISVISHIEEFPGVLQSDMYKRLHELDKEALKWTLRAYNNIEKVKYKNTNMLYIKGQVPDILPTVKNFAIEPSNKKELARNIAFPEWYIMISFGKSSSSNYIKALALAKHATIYQEQEDNGNITHSAVYGKSKKEYVGFIQLYETVSNWKSTFVICNGEIIDRKIVGQINYCYGDKCRSGKVDFCYGASMMTDNPFGCHRLQISRYNNPWWSFYRKVKGDYILDKGQIYERADSVAETYNYCPDFDLKIIKQVISDLPLMVKQREYNLLIDENQNYGNTLIKTNNDITLTMNVPQSKAKHYYQDSLTKDKSDKRSLVDKLLGFLKKG